MFDLHKQIYVRMQINDIELSIITAPEQAVQSVSVSDLEATNVLTVAYLRNRGQALNVERLMGREELANTQNIEARRHVVIEMRLSPAGFAIELLLSPDAWWDQENLVGKLSIARHKQDFYTILRALPFQYCLGFWKGHHLSDMHLKAAHFQHPRIMNEWMSTFQPGADWFRLGIWYGFDDVVLEEEQIIAELIRQIRRLYELYKYIAWSSDNNFREFYGNTR
jgi:hypothetical protein